MFSSKHYQWYCIFTVCAVVNAKKLFYSTSTYSMVTVNHASYLGGMIWCIAIFSLKGHFLVYKKLFILHRIFLQAPKMILAGKKMFDIRLQSRPRSQTKCLENNCFLQRDCFVFSTTIYCQWRKEDCPLYPGMGLCLQGHQSCL